MKYLFAPEGLAALDLAMRSQPLLAFDFDGTLAPIVAQPDQARVAQEISRRLEFLGQIRPLAIVTGRSVDDVANRLGFVPRFIVGNHGAEDPASVPQIDVAALHATRARIALCTGELRTYGIFMEDKGYSLALHFRNAENPRLAARYIGQLLLNLDPALRSFGGKDVVNIVLASAPDKGDAIESLLQRADCHWAVFVGDDVGDEAAFARARENWLTVRVGDDDPQSGAAFYLRSHEEISALLDCMIERVQGP